MAIAERLGETAADHAFQRSLVLPIIQAQRSSDGQLARP